ncbi:uncharacterized [Tachysurus ichikawai]
MPVKVKVVVQFDRVAKKPLFWLYVSVQQGAGWKMRIKPKFTVAPKGDRVPSRRNVVRVLRSSSIPPTFTRSYQDED